MFDRSKWQGAYDRDSMPKFNCPRCRNGRLIANRTTLKVVQPQFSITECDNPDFEPGWERERFTLELQCDEKSCEETAFAIGNTSAEQYYDEELNDYPWVSLICIRAFYPAPPIISTPEQTPHEILRELEKAFGLYWTDLNATANRLRVCVERIMDQQDVPSEALSKKKVMVPLDLNGRIGVFTKTHTEHAETFTALRMVGNLGSHGHDVQREVILDAFEVLEDCLAELYGERSARLGKIKKKLISTKGRG